MAVATARIVSISPTWHYRCQNCDARMRSADEFPEYQHGCGGLVKLDPPPIPTALDDARRFLELHPWSTTADDNPVELLEALVREAEADEDDEADENVEVTIEVEGDAPARVERLLGFIKGLRDARKISEAEYKAAQGLVAE